MAKKEIELSGVMTIAKAEALHHECEAALRDGLTITIDASELERSDTAIMQLLCVLNKQVQQAGPELSLSLKGGDAFDQYITLLGLHDLEQLSAA